jgi:hypothetical protein
MYLVAIPGLVAVDAVRDDFALLGAVAETLVEGVVLAHPEAAVVRECLQVSVIALRCYKFVCEGDW